MMAMPDPRLTELVTLLRTLRNPNSLPLSERRTMSSRATELIDVLTERGAVPLEEVLKRHAVDRDN
jgi:hypothetical protein